MVFQEKTPPHLRVITILNLLAEKGQRLTMSDFIAELKWPKQSLHRLINSMIDNGYLEKVGRFYIPSPHLVSLANGLLQFSGTFTVRRRILNELAELTGETINFVQPKYNCMTYTDRIGTNRPLQILLPVGSDVPFHCTASGKLYLANIRKSQRRHLLHDTVLKAHTNKTITSFEILEKELRLIRKNGYSIDHQEMIDGMTAIAVPVFDDKMRFYAALAVHAPLVRFSPEQAISLAPYIKDCARRLREGIFPPDDEENNNG